MKKSLKRLLASETGVTAIEYGLIAGLIAMVIFAGVSTLGTTLNTKFQAITNKVK